MANGVRVRQSQSGIKLQSGEGSAATLSGADCFGSTKDHSHDYEAETYERDITRTTLSSQGALVGARTLTLKRTDEVVGGGAALASEAAVHRIFKGCGLSEAQLKKVTVSSRSGGEFVAGQLIGNHATQGSATATGIVAYVDATVLVYLPVTGTFTPTTDTIYNYETSQVSATTSGSLTNGGHAFKPLSEDESNTHAVVTMERRMGGFVHRIVDGRGKCTLKFSVGKPLLVESEFMGPCADETPEDAALTGVPAASTVAPKTCLGTTLIAAGKSPVVTEVTIAIDNTMAKRPTLGASTLDSGNLATRITGRKITATLNPECTFAGYSGADKEDFLNQAFAATRINVVAMAGSYGHTHGLMVVAIPSGQISGLPGNGDRDGLATLDVTIDACGVSGDDEVYIFHVF